MLSAPIDNIVLVRFFRAFSMEKTRALFEDVVATLQQHTYVKGKRGTDLQDIHQTALRYGLFRRLCFFVSSTPFLVYKWRSR